MTQSTSNSIGRYAEIAKLFIKYRNAGVFTSGGSITSALGEAFDESGDVEPGKPEELVDDLEALGPAFVKIGQSLSTRPDLVSAEYIEALTQMQDRCSPIPFAEVRERVESELGVRLTKAFSEFDEEPLAAASLGQVHKAKLRDGTAVAVKIQRPDIEKRVSQDLSILSQLAEKVEQHSETGRQMGFTQWMTELRRSLTRELDYETEASNLETLGGLIEPYDQLVVPQPVWDLTSRRVLTMEFIPGVKIPDRSGVRQTEEDGLTLAEQLTRAYLDQLFIHGFVHVDPHPGNILITEDNRLAILDLGMVTHLSPRMRQQMLTLILAIVDGRGEEAAEKAVEMSEPLSDFNRTGAIRAASQMVSEYAMGKSQGSEGLLMLQMTREMAGHGLRPPPEVVLLGKALLNLEHLSQALAPEINIGEVVHDHLTKILRERAVQGLKPSAVISSALELNQALQKAPQQLSSVLTLLAENRLKVTVDAVDENRLYSNLQKIANRVAVGLIVAALIVGAAMLMRIQTQATLWGYPAFAMVAFLIAGLLGLGLVIAVIWTDRNKH